MVPICMGFCKHINPNEPKLVLPYHYIEYMCICEGQRSTSNVFLNSFFTFWASYWTWSLVIGKYGWSMSSKIYLSYPHGAKHWVTEGHHSIPTRCQALGSRGTPQHPQLYVGSGDLNVAKDDLELQILHLHLPGNFTYSSGKYGCKERTTSDRPDATDL